MNSIVNKIRQIVAFIGLLLCVVHSAPVSTPTLFFVGLAMMVQLFVPTYDKKARFGRGKWIMHPFFTERRK
jgi:hypothetical protein